MATSNDHPPDGWAFLGVGDPFLVVHDEQRGLLAVAGTDAHDRATPVAVHNSRSFVRRALIRSRFPVHALAFHPRSPLLAIGTGRYDGGYFFEGELLLLHLKTGVVASLIENGFGRQVLGLEWLDERSLRVLVAPPDDWQDEAAHENGHVAVVDRVDWTAVPARSLSGRDLAGPRTFAPRPEPREAVQRAVATLRSLWQAQRVESSGDL
ncbi:hypothetical protein [Streptomyces sp. SLBN-115]|uniref:hypothetical protein n=1 Tax=Streptomyces sp. SLBN-115 TaxID=2768453 RepID=UPI00114FC8F7|nr:hypothetical protein [Streptomyces sp. SLBN-115]TQJ55340.1 hypothetical protein FBY34_3139 [Streptomyces sp. SLBN-115]